MIELSYEGSTLIVFLIFLLGLGGIAAITAIVITTYLSSSDYREHISTAPPMWETTYTTVEHKKPVRRHSLPYGAYGTDIRGTAKRRSVERG